MRGPFRSIPVGVRTEIRLEDRFQNDLHRPLHHTVANAGDQQRSGFPVAFRDLDAPGRPRFIGALQEVCTDVLEKALAPIDFDILKGEAIAARGSPVCLRDPVGLRQGFDLGDVGVHPPEAVRSVRFRLPVYPSSQVLQTDRGFCHGLPASPPRRTVHRSGSFPPLVWCCTRIASTTTRSATLRRSVPFPTQGYRPGLDLGAFSPGPGGLLQLPLCPSHHVAAHTPPVGAAALGQISRLPLRPSHVVDRLGHRDRVTRLAMRSLALQPGELLTSLPGGFVNGLHGVGFPLPCHSSYEGLTCSLGRTFTGWITASLSGRAHNPSSSRMAQTPKIGC